MLVRCHSARTGQDSKVLLMDYMTDTVLAQFPNLAGRIHVTPDSRKLIVLQDGKHGVDIIVMRITGTSPSPFRSDIPRALANPRCLLVGSVF